MVTFSSFAGIVQKGNQFEHRFFIFGECLIQSFNRCIGNMLKMIDASQGMDIDSILVIAVKLWQINHFFDGWYGVSQQSCIGECRKNGVGVWLVKYLSNGSVECFVRSFRSWGIDEGTQKCRVSPEGSLRLFTHMFEHTVKVFSLGVDEAFIRRRIHIFVCESLKPYCTVEPDNL